MKINEIESQLKKLQEEVEKLKKNKYKISEVELLAADNVQTYETIKLNNLECMREDLSIEPSFGLGDEVGVWAEDGNHYYNWYAANIIAREIGDGWRLPTQEEFRELYKELGEYFYEVMKPELNGVCDWEGSLNYKGGYSYWWSSTPYSANRAYYAFLHSGVATANDYYGKDYGLSVRLVRETER